MVVSQNPNVFLLVQLIFHFGLYLILSGILARGIEAVIRYSPLPGKPIFMAILKK